MDARLVPVTTCLAMSGLISSCVAQTAALRPVSRCIVGEVCHVEGTLVAGERTGRIEGNEPADESDTNCVSVARPEKFAGVYVGVPVRASGKIYMAPDLPGLMSWKLSDRWVDAESCYSGLAMYVDTIELLR